MRAMRWLQARRVPLMQGRCDCSRGRLDSAALRAVLPGRGGAEFLSGCACLSACLHRPCPHGHMPTSLASGAVYICISVSLYLWPLTPNGREQCNPEKGPTPHDLTRTCPNRKTSAARTSTSNACMVSGGRDTAHSKTLLKGPPFATHSSDCTPHLLPLPPNTHD